MPMCGSKTSSFNLRLCLWNKYSIADHYNLQNTARLTVKIFAILRLSLERGKDSGIPRLSLERGKRTIIKPLMKKAIHSGKFNTAGFEWLLEMIRRAMAFNIKIRCMIVQLLKLRWAISLFQPNLNDAIIACSLPNPNKGPRSNSGCLILVNTNQKYMSSLRHWCEKFKCNSYSWHTLSIAAETSKKFASSTSP